MKSFFGVYSAPGAMGVDCTVLLFDKKISIGFQNDNGANQVIEWQTKDLNTHFDFASQTTRMRHASLPGELVIDGNGAYQYLQSLKAEQQKPWHQKSRGKEWIRNILLTIALLGVLYLLYMLIVPWLSEKLASKVSVKTEQQLGDAVYDALAINEKKIRQHQRYLMIFLKPCR
jgi:hypothetical protein